MLKIRNALALATLVGVFGVGTVLAFQPPKPPASESWKKVDDAIQKGLPKTAIEQLQPIIQSAMEAKRFPEAIKAIAKRIVLETQISGGSAEESIRRLDKEIESAPEAIQPVLHTIQGHFYWSYFQQNRWKFGQRTATSAEPSADFSTWDLKRLFQEIDKHYSQALAAEDLLLSIPIADFDDLLTKGTMPDSYRPTLFDFIAFEALSFYAAGEQAGALAEDAFEMDASSPALGDTAEFLAWQPQTSDESSVHLKAIRLYQKLLTIHAKDENKSAYLDADLGRLQFAYANAVGEERRDRYIAALKKFIEQNNLHELSALARYRWAQILVEKEERVEARRIAQEGKNAHPESIGGKLCSNFIAEIEAKSVQITTERVWATPASTLRVQYKNLTKLYFRVHRVQWMDRVRETKTGQFYPSNNERTLFDRTPPVRTWSADLPATEDFNLATIDIDAPTDLPPGFYFVQASSTENFSEGNNVVSGTSVWATNLGLVVNQAWNSNSIEGFVVDNKSGSPIANAKVTAIVIDNRERNAISEQVTNTNKDGKFSFNIRDKSVLLLAPNGENSLAIRDNLYLGSQQPEPPSQVQCNLFTDRSIFRPGQQVNFKGICLLADAKKSEYRVVPNHPVNVTFHDINGNVIESKSLKSNDFGSFSGTFNIPRERGTGAMSIQVTGMAGAMVQVEEYKRPKFVVELEAPSDSPKLNEEIAVRGTAKSYTGVSIQGAKVAFHVRRTVRWPIWFSYCFPWRIPPQSGESQEIAHGSVTTDADGKFEVKFPARPDRSVPAEDNPTFHYEVVANVTDSTGETRTDTYSVSVGYVALEANVTTSEWLTTENPIEFNITTNSLDGKPIPAQGKLKVYRLQEPAEIIRQDNLGAGFPIPMPRRGGMRGSSAGANGKQPVAPKDLANIASWEQGDLVAESAFDWKDDSKRQVALKLPKGIFRAIVETKDRFGKPVQAIANLQVIDPSAKNLGLKIPHYFRAEKWSLEPGEKFIAVWGTGYDRGQAFVEMSMNGKTIQSFWTDAKVTQSKIELAINEEMRGGVTIRLMYVRENRCYLESRVIDVPWSNKDLKLRWERLVSKLEPGKKEKFKLRVEGPKASKVVSELVATMYDASLDAYHPHHWMQKLGGFRHENGWSNWTFQNYPEMLMHLRGNFPTGGNSVALSYRSFPPDIIVGAMHPTMMYRSRNMAARGSGLAEAETPMALGMAAPAAPMAFAKSEMADSLSMSSSTGGAPGGMDAAPPAENANVRLDNVSPRKNLQELAFFLPHVSEGKDGSFEIDFTVPEALTSWRVMAFAHDKELRSGYLEEKVVTKKELMVEPNPPRFLREGDLIEFSVKVSNTGDQTQSGKVALRLSNALNDKSIDDAFGNANIEQSFTLNANASKSFYWKLKVPSEAIPIIYRAIGATDKVSDGEEGILAILSNRVLVTESLPLPIRGKNTKDFEFKKLLESGDSTTLKSQSFTVQMVSQPSWYAVLALPYLMEYPYQCSEQTFNRLYANSLAQHIAKSDPKIRRVLDVWKQLQPEALKSPLEKNQDIKTVMIEETPWLRDAQKETEARRNVGILFEEGRLASETQRALQQLAEMQNQNGMWPWFPGGPDNEYISLYIVTGFGRLKHLGVEIDTSPALRALQRLDGWMRERHESILNHSKTPGENHLHSTVCLYLYGRSFFANELPIAEENRTAFEYWKTQASKYWLSQPRQSQAQLALGLKRWGDKETPSAILKSILEFSSQNEEMGMFWRDQESSWWWYHAPVETQAMMIEALDEVANDAKSVEECKVWLLKQKQTQNWKTTKSTADAVYALLLRGNKMLASDELVEVQLGSSKIEPKNVEAGTGFYEEKFVRGEVKPEFGKIRVTKKDDGVSWGSVHWQYLEDISKVTPHNGTPLQLEKQIFKKVQTKSGSELVLVDGPVLVGDELVCRIVLRTDRDMEYVHLKDHRGSGTEPVNVISRYRYQDGLGYYESTRDTASHFFIDFLRKGTYVFEYSVRVQHAGIYPSGLANIECMYAPEFNSHSGSVLIEAKKE